jgi:cold shock CspA family protein
MPFGTVISFDNESGHGSIKSEASGADLGFERSDLWWVNKRNTPAAGERFSYAIGADSDGLTRARSIQSI